MKQTKLLKYQYPLAQFLYWVTCCACSGFVAVYLQYRGLSNTTIGIVVGAYGILSLILQPINSKIIQSIPFLTVRKMIMILLVVMAALFATISFRPASSLWAIIAFVIINALNGSMIPLMSSFGMEYVNQEKEVNFGLARGFGSLGWALSAVFIGFLLEKFSPEVLGYIYIISAGIMLLLVLSMEDMGQLTKQPQTEEKEEGVLWRCLKDTTFLLVAVGMFLGITSHALCTTYTINIVRNVGGGETAAGLAQFFGAGSEMIGMVAFGILIRKYSSIQVLKISSIFLVIRFLFLIFANNLPMVMIGYALQGPSAGLYIPATVYFVNERMLPQHRTQGQTIFNLLTNSLATLVGNLLGGKLLDQFGLQPTLVVCCIFAAVGYGCVMTRKEYE